MTVLHSPGFFVLRTPALPFAAQAEPLEALFARPEVADALAAAMPDLAAGLERGADAKALAALARVRARMAGRPTPFGLFSGVSLGSVGAATRLVLDGADRPHSRLDMDVLSALCERLQADPAVRAAATFRPNPGLYEAGGRLRYVEALRGPDGIACKLMAVVPQPELRAVLARAAGGATLAELAAALPGEPEAAAFVEELAGAQVLVSDLALAVVGEEPARPLARRARAAGAVAVADALEACLDELTAMDRAPAGERGARTAAIAERVRGLGVEPPPGRLVQVDLVRGAAGLALAPEVLEAVSDAIEVLRRVAADAPPPDLLRFRERFQERYGDRAVPLAEALDPEAGLGFGADAGGAPPATSDAWGAREQLMLSLLREGGREVVLDRARVKDLAPARLPGAFAALVIPASDGRLRLAGISGPSGANLLGRFCHADPRLRESVERHLRDEEARDPEAVFAEIAHLPEARTGNVLLRPRLREHEIVLLAGSDAPAAARIALGDLWLALEEGRLVLRSRALGRRVVPRLTTAHNVWGHGIGLYRFLATLAHQDAPAGLAWDWGRLATGFTPRVRCGNTVLALATWRLAADEIDGAGLPRWVGLRGGDAALPVDLESEHGRALVRAAAADGPVELEEWWPEPERLAVSGPGGAYAGELVIPFTLPPEPVAPEVPRVAEAVRRSFPPGSEWVSLKLYTSPAIADRILLDHVAPLAGGRWHFLRYGDPEFHLRLRFPHAARERAEAMAAGLLDEGLVWRVQADTYEREVARYGGPAAIALAEAAFAADSDAVLGVLAALPRGEEAAAERWRWGAAGALLLLRDLGVDAAAVLGRLRAQFGAEHGVDREGVRGLARRFRAERPALEAVVGQAEAGEGWAVALRERSARLAPVAAELHALARAGRLECSVEAIAESLVHMHLNRLLRARPREHELIVHDALDRLLASRAARFPVVITREPMECGAAALTAVAQHLGGSAVLDDVRALVGPGASLAELATGARALGLDADPLEAPPLDALPLPAIAHVDGDHWVVLYSLRDGRAELFDPAHGLASMPQARFAARWSGFALAVRSR